MNQAEQLRQYKELLDEGIITAEEFEQKKRQILGEKEYSSTIDGTINRVADDESLLWLWFLISFFFQIVGIVLFIIWREEKPKTAKYCLIGALIPIAITVIGIILTALVGFFSFL